MPLYWMNENMILNNVIHLKMKPVKWKAPKSIDAMFSDSLFRVHVQLVPRWQRPWNIASCEILIKTLQFIWCVCRLQTDSKIYTVRWCKGSQDNLEEEQDDLCWYYNLFKGSVVKILWYHHNYRKIGSEMEAAPSGHLICRSKTIFFPINETFENSYSQK